MQFLILGIVSTWLILDQALKFWTLANIPFGVYHHLEPIPGFLALGHDVNLGAAWSLFSGATPVLVAIRLLVGAALLWWVLKNPKPLLETIAFSLIVAGAWGNAIDGLIRGGVVDMLQSHWLTAVYQPLFGRPFPIFNLADTGVVSGVLLLLLHSFLLPTPPKKVPDAI